MIEFPSSTKVGKRLPKEAFYARLPISGSLKEKFVTDVDRIQLENSLTQETLHLNKDANVKEILILDLDLKKRDFDPKIVEAIARQNKHKIVFLLRFEGEGQLAVYYGKLYRTNWKPIETLNLKAAGFTLDEIWDGFLEQIALWDEPKPEASVIDKMTVDERLARQDAIRKLQKEIDKLEKLTRSEKQPKKKFELYQKLQDVKMKLERML